MINFPTEDMKALPELAVFGNGFTLSSYSEETLGGKGAKLAEMGSLGLPVPPGVTIPTDYCLKYFSLSGVFGEAADAQSAYVEWLASEVLSSYEGIAEELGYMPLVSVRSGARVSMPGMMDTVLNVGLTSENYDEWVGRLGKGAADDCYRRLIEMYGDVVLGIPLSAGAWDDCATVIEYLDRFESITGFSFPDALEEQLAGCISAVFDSWFSDRARAYRVMHGYPDTWGTAVNIQTMVFGNRNDNSLSGVMFTRNFNSGEPELVIDWLPKAQGEDVVAGTHVPKNAPQLSEEFPAVFSQLAHFASLLENHYRDMQDIEFTVEDGLLYILQTRNGKRAALASFRIAYDMVAGGLITKEEARQRVSGREFVALTAPSIDPSYMTTPDLTGTPASGSLVSGVAVLSADDAVSCKQDCILVANETTPDDFSGMAASVGVLTRTGGITSHAAVVARGMNKTCVVGAENLKFEGLAGKRITLNGVTGDIWIDKNVPIIDGQVPEFVGEMLDWWIDFEDCGSGNMLTLEPEEVTQGSRGYVDLSNYLDSFTLLSKTMDSLKGGSGIISFGNNDEVSESDRSFLGFFGVATGATPTATYEIIEKVLSLGKWNNKFKKSWAIHLPNDAEVLYANLLREKGWSVVARIDSFKAAFSADGYVTLDAGFIEQLEREDMDFSEITSILIKAGNTVAELPVVWTRDQLIFDVLGG